MGGTFDPIHLGHLVAAEEARERYNLEEVIFVPAGYPPHKEKEELSSQEHRYMMTVIATINNPIFKVSRVELEAESYTYTVDTVAYFRKTLGPDKNLYFITGADAILDITTWEGYERLLEMCYFIAVTRPGFSLEHLEDKLKSLDPRLFSRILILSIPGMAISSTCMRRRVKKGKTIKYLTTSGVEQYILKNKLYKQV
ncbi:MAG: nicotinate-nucleotide adenylyltransferase [Candidatus Syntrophonatronum acetioxidans]|uniref:Probable nicotinate-nucleotide adenylyltransferase n=1 Tax=Candidatus Syntrophonatronum acetioxidans TaxID=1795816 RepID=A0A424YG35_9FIRM|nr:MAG: nicotinate-nucleotide adenylyltransferase [Candidatus Syntrophonatronum acetioxidans]